MIGGGHCKKHRASGWKRCIHLAVSKVQLFGEELMERLLENYGAMHDMQLSDRCCVPRPELPTFVCICVERSHLFLYPRPVMPSLDASEGWHCLQVAVSILLACQQQLPRF